jgi:hypothetical protein
VLGLHEIGNALQRGQDRELLPIAEPREVVEKTCLQGSRRLILQGPAGIRQYHVHLAPIRVASLSRDEAALLEPIDQARGSGLCEAHPFADAADRGGPSARSSSTSSWDVERFVCLASCLESRSVARMSRRSALRTCVSIGVVMARETYQIPGRLGAKKRIDHRYMYAIQSMESLGRNSVTYCYIK